MRILLQRVSRADVTLGGVVIGEIGAGLLLFVGIEREDTPETVSAMAARVLNYRVFPDAQGRMNLSVSDRAGELLVVPQFTLCANTRRGRRPSFDQSAPPEQARSLFDRFVVLLETSTLRVATGCFGADMQVGLINDGPVTFLLD